MDRRDMRSQFAAAIALLQKGTRTATGTALKQLNEMLREDQMDRLGLRDLIPHVLLRLDREQECYDFIKWWAKTSDENSGDPKLPFLSIHGANACEPLNKLTSKLSSLGLGQLVALTLLKLRLYLDLSAIESSLEEMGFGYGDPDIDRPVGKIAKMKTRSNDPHRAEELAEAMKSQYLELCRVVNNANPYFWEILVDDEPCSPPDHYSPGSREEAELVLYQCQHAWQESEDAILMIGADTASLTRVYQGSTTYGHANQAQSKIQEEVGTQLEKRRGTGAAFPSRIKHSVPVSVKLEEFVSTSKNNNQSIRFVSRNDPRKVLVYTDGACLNNGQLEPRAGWAVLFGPPGDNEHRGCVSGRLEEKGPFGDDSIATSNRAELRAVIAALRLCNWRAESFDEIVVATDSTYVIDGATSWAKGWVRNGWKLRSGGDVKNRDLWELLLGEVERWQTHELRVGLLKIPRELNIDADAAAKQAAGIETAKAEFSDITLSSVQASTTKAEPRPGVLALCLAGESLFDDICGTLISSITSKGVELEKVTTPEAALSILGSDSCPSTILVADGDISRHRKVWECVIDRLREGSTVVLAGCFSAMVNGGEFDRFFARLGLPWQRGSYHRTDVTLQSGAIDAGRMSHLPRVYSQKAVFVKNIERQAAWYTETATSTEAAVAFTKVGSGWLGYVGDVNSEQSSDKVVLAMCGLL